ncbi:MAG TPA: EAL domain-containing protein [Anaeromyxobacteraceae bacterium]|nr:EAL domain-containing protein [Anaeromyxobacteraceae bacterium]
MRRKIVLSLLGLFACSTTGAALAVHYISSTTAEVRHLTDLHRIQEMRKHLVITIQASRSDLYTARAPLAQRADVITENVANLEEAAARCGGCHHAPAIAGRIDRINGLIGQYQVALSYYMTASANRGRIATLEADAAALGDELLRTTEDMAFEASRRVDELTAGAMRRFDQARVILTITIVVTLLAAAGVAVRLTTSITRPIEELVRATRAIAAGNLGFSIPVRERNEFGELAEHFNAMSAGLRQGYAALQAEIEERKNAEARLLHDAFHDALTGLPNRALLLDRLQHVIDGAKRRPDQRFAVLFLDLDRFKVINDTLGHIVGDHLLVAVGRLIEGCLRPGDTVARLGGDEFGVILDEISDADDTLLVAERILGALGHSLAIDGHEVFVTTSIGVALGRPEHERPEQLLRDADIAMYQAKQKGKACAVVFDAAMHGDVVDRLELEADLRKAVERCDEFVLHYQPIFALPSRRLVGLEALVRWRHPRRGLLDATRFVPLAEESGTIVPLGEWAVQTACAQLQAWKARSAVLGQVTMSINVSGRQFRQPDVVDALKRIIRQEGVEPRQLAVEITESVIMDDVTASAAKLAQLRDLGIQIHVDDFGTGYSSLSYLHRFPITAVKIDRTFVSGIPTHAESEEVIKAIVSIAESLGFDVIAEGVEAEAHAERLQALRCGLGQGYHLARPMPADALEAWAETRAKVLAVVA